MGRWARAATLRACAAFCRGGVRRVLCLAAPSLAALVLPTPARAAELSAQGPEECPDATELAFRVERNIGMPLGRAAPLGFAVVFEPPAAEATRYTAHLETRRDAPDGGVSARRDLSARDCGQLGDAVSVAIALALGSRSAAFDGLAPDSEPPSSEPLTQEPAAAPQDTAAAPMSPEPEGSGLRPVMSLAALVDSGSLPSPGAGVGLGAELRARRIAVRAAGTLLFDQHVALDGAGGPGADFSLALGSLSVCTTPLGTFRSELVFSACAGWELGRLSAVGTGVSTPRRGNRLWSAPRIDAGVAWAAPGTALGLGLQLSLLAPLERDDFYLRDLGAVHHAPVLVGRLALGADIHF